MFGSDVYSERATDIPDYQNTCSEFIIDISRDYKDWVDRYNLIEGENIRRKEEIDKIVHTTNQWIFLYGQSIKKIDIIMNDGISKMAEITAGYPFPFEISVDLQHRYIVSNKDSLRLNIKATTNQGDKVRVGEYQQGMFFLINSVHPIEYNISTESLRGSDILNDYLMLNLGKNKGQVLSLTVIVEELKNNSNSHYVYERRGYTTLIIHN